MSSTRTGVTLRMAPLIVGILSIVSVVHGGVTFPSFNALLSGMKLSFVDNLDMHVVNHASEFESRLLQRDDSFGFEFHGNHTVGRSNGELFTTGIGAAPICIVYNIPESTFPPILAWNQLYALLVGGNVSFFADAVTRSNVTSADVTVAFPVESDLTEQLYWLLEEQTAGGTHQSFEALIEGNPRVISTADDNYTVSYVTSTPNAIGFVPMMLAVDQSLPCMPLLVPVAQNEVVSIPVVPRLSDGELVPVHGYLESHHVWYRSTVHTVYPFVTPVMLTVNKALTCRNATRELYMHRNVVALLLDPSFKTSMSQWSSVALGSYDMLHSIQYMQDQRCDKLMVTCKTGGSSALKALVADWSAFHFRNGDESADFSGVDWVSSAPLHIYEGIGSDTVLSLIRSGEYRLGVSELEPTAEDAATHTYVAVTAFGISIVANVPGARTITFDRCDVVDIFRGAITTWGHPSIRARNPTMFMPADQPIDIMVPPAASGTATVFRRGLVELARQCGVAAVDQTWVLNVASAGTSSAIVRRISTTAYSLSFLPTPLVHKYELAEALLRGSTAHSLAASTPFHVQEALDAARDGEHGILELALSNASYPFVGVSYFVVLSDVSIWDPNEAALQVSAIKFAKWALTSTKAAAFSSNLGFFRFSTSRTKLLEQRLQQVRVNGQLVFPPTPSAPAAFSALVITFIAVMGAIVILVAVFFIFKRNTIADEDIDTLDAMDAAELADLEAREEEELRASKVAETI